jgi:Zn-dependent protease with chaperone function
VHAGGRYHLVIASALLTLFQNRPGELRYVVGRELGHIRCGHTELERKAYAVLSAIQGINTAIVRDRYQSDLPLLALGRLLTWSRESESSADRATQLCCGEPQAAYEAIMRLQHGLEADSLWIDPYAKGFDPQAVILSFQDWL